LDFLALFVSLPTKASTGRMRVWRAVKALGCATLRDGVYLLPDSSVSHAADLEDVAELAIEVGGTGEVFLLTALDEIKAASLRGLFNRSDDYAALAEEVKLLRQGFHELDDATALRKLQGLVRRFEQTSRIDFFPGETQRQVSNLLDELRGIVTRRLSPDEPSPTQAAIERLDRARYQGQTWATRSRPWVDRLTSAWLIRRFIDPSARIVWMTDPAECQADWIGFDFDQAAFTHVGAKVTFETLLTSFGLDSNPPLVRLGELVHYLDVGGLPVPDAQGIESVLAGLHACEPNDDRLLDRASEIFDWLLRHYEEKKP